jgi:hypothetical protein
VDCHIAEVGGSLPKTTKLGSEGLPAKSYEAVRLLMFCWMLMRDHWRVLALVCRKNSRQL